MYGIKPVELERPANEMSVCELKQALNKWETCEWLAHVTVENNKGSGCLTAMNSRWLECQRLVKEVKSEMERRGINVQ